MDHITGDASKTKTKAKKSNKKSKKSILEMSGDDEAEFGTPTKKSKVKKSEAKKSNKKSRKHSKQMSSDDEAEFGTPIKKSKAPASVSQLVLSTTSISRNKIASPSRGEKSKPLRSSPADVSFLVVSDTSSDENVATAEELKKKHRIGYFDVPDYEEAEKTEPAEISKVLACPLCLDLLYKPVTVSCGHSLCRICLIYAMQSMTSEMLGRFRCPCCRKILCIKCCNRLSVDVTLWSVIQNLYPSECKQRGEEAEAKQFKDAHELLSGKSAAASSTTNLIAIESCDLFHGCQLNRSVIRDDDDPSMRLALGLDTTCPLIPTSVRCETENFTESWNIVVCLLELEEDEYEYNCGFPALLGNSSEVQDILVRRAYEGNISFTFYCSFVDDTRWTKIYEVSKPFEDGRSVIGIDSDCFPDSYAGIKFDVTISNRPELTLSLTFIRSEKANKVKYFAKAFLPIGKSHADDDSESGAIDIQNSEGSDDEESEAENWDQYENDGFIVDDEEEMDYSEEEELRNKKKRRSNSESSGSLVISRKSESKKKKAKRVLVCSSSESD